MDLLESSSLMASRPPYPMPQLPSAMLRAGVINSVPPARISSASSSPSSNPAKDAQLAAARARREQTPSATNQAAKTTPDAPQLTAAQREQAEADALYDLAFGAGAAPKNTFSAEDEAAYEAMFGKDGAL